MLKKILKTGGLKFWEKNVDSLRKNHPLLSLFWECTLCCNFNCLHCGSNASNNRNSNELKTGEIKKALKEVSQDFNPKKINLNITGGEPLLRKDLFEVMTFAKNLGFSWGIVSNGYLIDENCIKKMQFSGLSTISISIDGLRESHDNFRQCKGSYLKAINAVKLLSKTNFVKELNVTTVVHKKNIDSLEKIFKIVKKSGANSWRLVNIEPIGRAKINNNLLLTKKKMKSLLMFIRKKRKTSSIDVTYECGGFLGNDLEGEVRENFFMCFAGITVGSILANGDIFVCPNVPRLKHLIQGNVKKDRFGDIWNNKFDFFRNKERTICTECKKCEHWNNCLGNSMHLWDFKNNKPQICHLKILK